MATATEVALYGTLSASRLNRRINIVLVRRASDWKTRQKIQYEALKGLLMQDFVGLKDYERQLGILMRAGTIGQKIAWAFVKPMIKLQPRLRASTVIHPRLGVVGRFLLTLFGFDAVFRAPEDILIKRRF